MKTKKSPKADLEKKKAIFLEIGLIVSLSLVLYSFEMGSPNKTIVTNYGNTVKIIDEDIIPVVPDRPKPQPVEADKPIARTEINIVDNNHEQDSVNIFNNENINDPVNPVIFTWETDTAGNDAVEVIEFYKVEVKPLFPGGDIALLEYLAKNCNYPSEAVENGVEGTVYISFVINETGKVTNISIARSIHPVLDKEAVRVVEGMPDWTPGKQREKAVPVSYIIPIKFKLY